MATFAQTTPATRISGFSAHGLFARLHDWNDARRTRNTLLSLTPEQLDDIGLVPGDIDRIAKRSV